MNPNTITTMMETAPAMAVRAAISNSMVPLLAFIVCPPGTKAILGQMGASGRSSVNCPSGQGSEGDAVAPCGLRQHIQNSNDLRARFAGHSFQPLAGESRPGAKLGDVKCGCPALVRRSASQPYRSVND